MVLDHRVHYLENNRQVEGVMYDTTYQPAETLNTYAMVNKIVSFARPITDFRSTEGYRLRVLEIGLKRLLYKLLKL